EDRLDHANVRSQDAASSTYGLDVIPHEPVTGVLHRTETGESDGRRYTRPRDRRPARQRPYAASWPDPDDDGPRGTPPSANPVRRRPHRRRDILPSPGRLRTSRRDRSWLEVDRVVRDGAGRDLLEPVRRLRRHGDHIALAQVVRRPSADVFRARLPRRGLPRLDERAAGDERRFALGDDEDVVRLLVHFD